MANTAISGLTASATNLAAADVLPVVKTTGVGPVKMTGQQLAGGLLGSTTLSGTTITANAPVVDFAQTWNNAAVTFTGAKLNITDTASNAASLLMDLGTGGGSFVSRFKVQKNGDTTFNLIGGPISINNANGIDVGTFSLTRVNSVQFGAGNDLILGRRTSANLRLGAADAAAPVAQTLSVQSVVAGTTNTIGQEFRIDGSQGTGTGAGGSLVFRVAPAGSSGSAQNALATALTINADRSITVAANASSLAQIAMADRGPVILAYATPFGTQPLLIAMPGGVQINNDTGGFWLGATADVRLYRDAANTLALRNGTAAQTFNVYNTFTDASNYERGFVRWSSSRLGVGVENAGTGSRRALDISGGSISFKCLSASDNNAWFMLGTGDFTAATDNAYDIGASGGNRPRTGYFGTSIIAPTIQVGSSANQTITSPSANTLDLRAAGATYFQLTAGKWNFLNWNSGNGSTITSSGPFGGVTNRSADPLILICEGGSGSASPGSIQFRAAPSTTSGTDGHVDEEAMRIRVSSAGVSILSFNGVTSSFPAIKRSSTTLQARLADDSDFAPVQGKLTTDTAYTAGDPTTTGYIIIYDSTGTAYRVPALAN